MMPNLHTSHNKRVRDYKSSWYLDHKTQSFTRNLSIEAPSKTIALMVCEKLQMKITKIGERDLESDEEVMGGNLNRLELTKVEDFIERLAT